MNPPEEYINNFQEQHQDINKFNNNSNVPAINSLDKVRDILVGNQMREVEKKFTRLEERLIKESANVRDEAKKRLDALENYIKKEVESLTEQLKIEQLERDAIVRTLAEEHKNITSSLEKKVTQFNEQTTNSQRDLREQILNQSKNLQDEIRQKYEEILVLLEQETKELRRDQTDRSHLAALFSELAIRLNYDTKS
ncbi:MAG: hypothetical protein KME40_12930 [Komarekiella atlantica HA4396-MV6]|jgi:DNA anti-recombination protein RmuC|nr:hypothetical protein [Komarekiella atlantica HA4396-MV6]